MFVAKRTNCGLGAFIRNVAELPNWKRRQNEIPTVRMVAILVFMRLLTIITEHLRDNLVAANMSQRNSMLTDTKREPFVDAVAAADFLHIRPRRVLELARQGEIPAYPLGNANVASGVSCSPNLPLPSAHAV